MVCDGIYQTDLIDEINQINQMDEMDQIRVFSLTFDLSPCSALVGDKTDISRPDPQSMALYQPYKERWVDFKRRRR